MRFLGSLIALALAIGCALSDARAQDEENELPNCKADFQNVMLKAVATALRWGVKADPVHIVGSIYFVGTQGLGVYLIDTADGHILINTGLHGSGQMIEASINRLKQTTSGRIAPEKIKWLLANHAHVDHVGGHAYIKRQYPQIQVAMSAADKPLLESGGDTDFHYRNCSEFRFDRVDVVEPETAFKFDPVSRTTRFSHGGVSLQIIPVPGHTPGATAFVMQVQAGKQTYRVVFADGTSVNPGYKVRPNKQSYPGIRDDFRATFRTLLSLKPDIWLTPHTADFDFETKQTATTGVQAWLNQKGADSYECFIAKHWLKFETRAFGRVGKAFRQVAKHCGLA